MSKGSGLCVMEHLSYCRRRYHRIGCAFLARTVYKPYACFYHARRALALSTSSKFSSNRNYIRAAARSICAIININFVIRRAPPEAEIMEVNECVLVLLCIYLIISFPIVISDFHISHMRDLRRKT